MRVLTLVFASVVGLVCLEARAVIAAGDEAPPNIILIMADDLGWSDTAVTGSRYYETPHIDQLAAQGVRFTQAYAAAAVCSPSRSAILTGRYPARTGVTHILPWYPTPASSTSYPKTHAPGYPTPAFSTSYPKTYTDVGRPLLSAPRPDQLPLAEVTIPERLRARGYASVMVGKWHLGGPGYLPEDQGFDRNAGGSSVGRPPSYFDPYTSDFLTGRIGFASRRDGEYLIDRELDEILAFVRENRDQPFFLYWSSYAVHKPLQAKPEMIAHFQDKPASNGHDNPVYAAMIAHLDDAVGRLMATLESLNLSGNTVVIFTSDNGAPTDVTSNAPLRDGKSTPYEGGLRVPLFIRWPGVSAPGTTIDTVTHGIDLFPTILEIAGATPPKKRVIDGLSLVQLLKSAVAPQREALFWHFPHYQLANHPEDDIPPYSVVRAGDWKLIRYYEEDRLELFDLARDPSETRDLAQAYPDRARALNQRLERWLEETGAKRPKANPDFNIWQYRLETLRASASLSYIRFRTLLSRIKRALLGETPR